MRHYLDQAAPLALKTVTEYLTAHTETPLERVIFAMYGQTEYDAFEKAEVELGGEAA